MKRVALVIALVAVACSGVGAVIPPDSQECESPTGSPTDLASQPDEWLDYGTYLRWTDTDGCLVRIDVISHHRGAEHCGWARTQYITIGTPIGTSIEDGRPETLARYLWDPGGVLPDGPFGSEMDRADLSDSATDTGYRRYQSELWLDESDESVIYVIAGDEVQVWEEEPREGAAACA